MRLKSKVTDKTTPEQEKENLKKIRINQLENDIKQREGRIRIYEQQGNSELVRGNRENIAKYKAELAELKGEQDGELHTN